MPTIDRFEHRLTFETRIITSYVYIKLYINRLIAFTSPSVLDRLNALLEPGGVLTIDERGVIDGEIPSIKPHPNFR